MSTDFTTSAWVRDTTTDTAGWATVLVAVFVEGTSPGETPRQIQHFPAPRRREKSSPEATGRSRRRGPNRAPRGVRGARRPGRRHLVRADPPARAAPRPGVADAPARGGRPARQRSSDPLPPRRAPACSRRRGGRRHGRSGIRPAVAESRRRRHLGGAVRQPHPPRRPDSRHRRGRRDRFGSRTATLLGTRDRLHFPGFPPGTGIGCGFSGCPSQGSNRLGRPVRGAARGCRRDPDSFGCREQDRRPGAGRRRSRRRSGPRRRGAAGRASDPQGLVVRRRAAERAADGVRPAPRGSAGPSLPAARHHRRRGCPGFRRCGVRRPASPGRLAAAGGDRRRGALREGGIGPRPRRPRARQLPLPAGSRGADAAGSTVERHLLPAAEPGSPGGGVRTAHLRCRQGVRLRILRCPSSALGPA